MMQDRTTRLRLGALKSDAKPDEQFEEVGGIVQQAAEERSQF
jgi:hypothetical protein